jgi:hypothetical protein
VPNQYTKAREEGREPPAGSNQFLTGKREHHSEATRDKMRAERAAIVLETIMGEQEASRQERIAAAKALIPFGKATLASVLQTNVDQPPNEDELLAQLRALIAAKPELARELNIGLRLVESPDAPQQEAG